MFIQICFSVDCNTARWLFCRIRMYWSISSRWRSICLPGRRCISLLKKVITTQHWRVKIKSVGEVDVQERLCWDKSMKLLDSPTSTPD